MRAVALLGVLYCVAGIVFGGLASEAVSHQVRDAWRLAAWVVSAVAFEAHIVYEQVRLRSSPRVTAFHASSAVALWAFGLAVAANLHAQTGSPQQHSMLLVLSLAIWPVITALPAFVVALAAAAMFARVWRSA